MLKSTCTFCLIGKNDDNKYNSLHFTSGRIHVVLTVIYIYTLYMYICFKKEKNAVPIDFARILTENDMIDKIKRGHVCVCVCVAMVRGSQLVIITLFI